MVYKEDAHLRRAVARAARAVLRQIESEPRVIEVEFNGDHQNQGKGTSTDIGTWLFHRRQENEHSSGITHHPGDT